MSAAERLPVEESRLPSSLLTRSESPRLAIFPGSDHADKDIESSSCRKIWGLTEGAAGMVSQVTGLAQAVGWPFQNRTTVLKMPFRRFWPGFLPRRLALFQESGNLLDDVPPRLVISCGRQAVVASLALKRRYGEQVFTVHIQHPRVRLSHFDLIIVPEHDGVSGKNVLQTLGAIHHVSPERLSAAAREGRTAEMGHLSNPFIGVILGGPNKYYRFRPEEFGPVIEQLKQLVRTTGSQLAVIPSRRTPASIKQLFQNTFGNDHFVWNGQGENPYLPVLALAERLIVTGDSVSMLSEAAATEKPLHVIYLPESREARRFRIFHESFASAGITRPFDGTAEDWSYRSPDRTKCIAQLILDHLEKR